MRSLLALLLGISLCVANAAVDSNRVNSVWSFSTPSNDVHRTLLKQRGAHVEALRSSQKLWHISSGNSVDDLTPADVSSLFFPSWSKFPAPWSQQANPGAKVFQSPSVSAIFDSAFKEEVPGVPGVSFAEVFEKIEENNCLVYIFGGMVRDSLLGKEGKDTDVAFSCTAEDIAKIADKYGWPHTAPAHGYIKIGRETEGAKDQLEGKESTTSLYAANFLREFACNSLFFDLSSNKAIIDVTGYGVEDTLNHVVRIPGPPSTWPQWTSSSVKKLFRLWKMRVPPKNFDVEQDTLTYITSTIKSLFVTDKANMKKIAVDFFESRISGLDVEKQLYTLNNLRKALSTDLGEDWYKANLRELEPQIGDLHTRISHASNFLPMHFSPIIMTSLPASSFPEAAAPSSPAQSVLKGVPAQLASFLKGSLLLQNEQTQVAQA